MNILITGIHGFVGTNLVKALGEEHRIWGLDIVQKSVPNLIQTYSWAELDSLPNDEISKIDVVIHLAGKAHDVKNTSEASEYFKVNYDLTRRIFDWVVRNGVSKLIFFSSVKAAADYVNGDVLTEDVVPCPVGPYGESKIAAEKYIQENIDKLSAEQKVYILRPAMIHGPGNKGNLNLLYNVVSKGIPWPLGAFDNNRSFTSIDNLTYALSALIKGNASSGIYNMCDDAPLSTTRLVELICQTLGKKARVWSINKKLIEIVASVGSILHLPLNKSRLQKLTENYVVSNAKIKSAIGIDAFPVTSEDGIRHTLISFTE